MDNAGSITKVTPSLHSRPRARQSGANSKSSVEKKSTEDQSNGEVDRSDTLTFEQLDDVVQRLNNQSEMTHVILYIVSDCSNKKLEVAVYHYETLEFLGQLPDWEVIKIADCVTIQSDLTNAFTGKLISDFV